MAAAEGGRVEESEKEREKEVLELTNIQNIDGEGKRNILFRARSIILKEYRK